MNPFTALFGSREYARNAEPSWKRKKCKSCVKFPCSNGINEQNQACKNYKGKKK